MTRTGTAVKSFPIDIKFGRSGNSLGNAIPPAASLMIAIPAVITTKTTAKATDKAEVYCNESASDQGHIITMKVSN